MSQHADLFLTITAVVVVAVGFLALAGWEDFCEYRDDHRQTQDKGE